MSDDGHAGDVYRGNPTTTSGGVIKEGKRYVWVRWRDRPDVYTAFFERVKGAESLLKPTRLDRRDDAEREAWREPSLEKIPNSTLEALAKQGYTVAEANAEGPACEVCGRAASELKGDDVLRAEICTAFTVEEWLCGRCRTAGRGLK